MQQLEYQSALTGSHAQTHTAAGPSADASTIITMRTHSARTRTHTHTRTTRDKHDSRATHGSPAPPTAPPSCKHTYTYTTIATHTARAFLKCARARGPLIDKHACAPPPRTRLLGASLNDFGCPAAPVRGVMGGPPPPERRLSDDMRAANGGDLARRELGFL